MRKNTIINDLSVGKITPVLLKFAFPIMMSNLLQTVYNMVDMVVVGQYVGRVGLSAVSIGGELLNFYMFISMGFATAGQIMMSQYVGAGKRKDLNDLIGTQFTFILLLGAAVTVIGLATTRFFLNVLNTPAEAYQGAYEYLTCCVVGLTLTFGYNSISAILRGMGDSKRPMIFIGIASVINIILDLLFVVVFRMGAFGAAFATVISQGVSLVLCMLYLYRNREQFGFDFKLSSFRIRPDLVRVLLKLGIPIAIQTSASNISALFVGSFVNSYGVVVSAVTGVGNKLNRVALVVANSLNVSSAAMVGQSFGAGKIDRVKQIFYRVFLFNFVFLAGLSVLIILFPIQIFSIFNTDSEVLVMAYIYAPVAAVGFMGFAVRSPSLGFINGLGHAKMNSVMGIVEGLIIRIGLTYLLGVVLGFGINGFWYGTTIASYGYGLVIFPYFFFGKWERRKSVVSSAASRG